MEKVKHFPQEIYQVFRKAFGKRYLLKAKFYDEEKEVYIAIYIPKKDSNKEKQDCIIALQNEDQNTLLWRAFSVWDKGDFYIEDMLVEDDVKEYTITVLNIVEDRIVVDFANWEILE